jgi:hypothetical protein
MVPVHIGRISPEEILMSTSLLTLGSFSFLGFESPDRISVKSKQRLAAHHLGSGISTVDCLGEDSQIASFRGTFTGTNAADRIRSIEYLRVQGRPVALTWGSQTLSVIIQAFELSYVSNQWIPYKLTCVVAAAMGLGVENALDSISQSPDMQVVDILDLLRKSYVNATSDQMAALTELATINYDVAPFDAIQRANELGTSISSMILTQDSALQVDGGPALVADEKLATTMIDLIAAAGQEASLVFARNRIACLVINCQSNNRR